MMSTETLVVTADALPGRQEVFAAGSFTSKRIERIVHLAAGVGSLIVGLQAFFAALGSSDAGVWHVPFTIIIFTSLIAFVVSCFTGRGLRTTAIVFVTVYTLVVVSWPWVSDHASDPGYAQPWIWYVTNIATIAAVLVMSMPWQITFTIGLPVLFFGARMFQVDFANDYWAANAFDLSFGLCLGTVLLILVRTLRATGRAVDEARGTALAEYTQAAAAEAAESERISMAALMHDSVMAALISATRASTDRERALTVGMAQEALTGLADAESDARMALGRPISARVIATDLTNAARDFGADLEIAEPSDVEVPGHVARALTLAATQAIANAIQHADGVGLTVVVSATPTACGVRVTDSGGGINFAAIPADRLGIRASIYARIAAVGGTTEITSQPGRTVVDMRWRR